MTVFELLRPFTFMLIPFALAMMFGLIMWLFPVNDKPIVKTWIETDSNNVAWLHTFTAYPDSEGGIEKRERLNPLEEP